MQQYDVEKINWPTALTPTLKEKLLSIAYYSDNFSAQMTQNVKPQHPGVYYFIKGLATFSYTTPNMKNIRGCVFGTGDWIGANSLFRTNSLFLLPETLVPLEFLYFPRDKIEQLSLSSTEIYKWLFYCINNSQPKIMQSQLTALHDKTCRIVYTLLELARYTPFVLGSFPSIRISQQQLSTVTGLSRPRINEVLKILEKKCEISLERGCIHILNQPALNKYLHELNVMFHDPRNTIA
jgi:CRP/FNR family transcriptional regulator, cyclic AMP receptor protein